MSTANETPSRLRLARERAGLKQSELAERAQVGIDTVGRLERFGEAGGNVGTFRRLADALKVSPAWLAFGIGPETAPELGGRQAA